MDSMGRTKEVGRNTSAKRKYNALSLSFHFRGFTGVDGIATEDDELQSLWSTKTGPFSVHPAANIPSFKAFPVPFYSYLLFWWGQIRDQLTEENQTCRACPTFKDLNRTAGPQCTIELITRWWCGMGTRRLTVLSDLSSCPSLLR